MLAEFSLNVLSTKRAVSFLNHLAFDCIAGSKVLCLLALKGA